jgi:hypothetical protein
LIIRVPSAVKVTMALLIDSAARFCVATKLTDVPGLLTLSVRFAVDRFALELNV